MKSYSFLISGCGDLGIKVLKKIIQKPGAYEALSLDKGIVAETKTQLKHPFFKQIGVDCKTAADDSVESDHLLIAFPPGETYVEDVAKALAQWNGKGVAVMISSTGVYEENTGSEVSEGSQIKKDSLIVEAEAKAIEKGAHVLRLAGLYDRHKGPHLYWQEAGLLKSNPQGMINLLHRADAADAIYIMINSLYKDPSERKTWHLSDSHPLTREEIVNEWNKNLPAESKITISSEQSSKNGLGKKVNAKAFSEHFSWTPRYESFAYFSQGFSSPRSVLGRELKSCCQNPITGFFRDGYCRTVNVDQGSHIICAELTDEFLEFSKAAGNDLSTPRPEFKFRGLRHGDKWCLCASRWVEALANNVAPKIYLESTHEQMLEWVDLEILKAYSLDLN